MHLIIEKIKSKKNLTAPEIREVFENILEPEIQDETIREFFLALADVPVSVDWLVEAAKVLLSHAKRVELGGIPAIDTSGTGGDRSGSFNFSTAAGILAAASGVPVAKHGNRSISSRSGSADLLEALGIPIDLDPEEVAISVKNNRFGFMMAPRYHPATARVQKVRRELGVVTVFNFLGPLVNPAGVRRQVVGVFDNRLRPVMAEALQRLGTEKAWVVWGEGGLDELTLAGKTYVSEVTPSSILEQVIEPEDAVLRRCDSSYLQGGDAQENAKILVGIFNKSFFGPLVNAVLLNTAAALVVGGAAGEIREGVRQARLAIENGNAEGLLNKLKTT